MSGWALSLYPEAAEGGGCLVVTRRALPAGGPPDGERSAEEAARRARTKIRRYAAANRLNRLGTLTFRGAGCHEPLLLREHLGSFFRQLRGEGRFPYLWVPQWHPGGHGLHAHFAVGRYVPRRRSSGRGRMGSCTSSCSTASRSARARWRRHVLLPATWPATSGAS